MAELTKLIVNGVDIEEKIGQLDNTSVEKQIDTAGWYKVADFNHSTRGTSHIVSIGRCYFYDNSESYTLSINLAYGTGKITLISNQVNSKLITKVALYYNNDSNYTMSLYVYYNASRNNECYFSLMCGSNRHYTLHDFVATTPSGTLLQELTL